MPSPEQRTSRANEAANKLMNEVMQYGGHQEIAAFLRAFADAEVVRFLEAFDPSGYIRAKSLHDGLLHAARLLAARERAGGEH